LIPELLERMREVLESGEFILGPNLDAFEREAAAYLGVEETIGVANGTDALVLVLDAMGIGPGDEVICPAFTFFATAEAIARLDVQLLPDQEPLRARGRRARRRPGRRARRPRPDAALPRLARQGGLPADRLQLAARRAPGGGAARVPGPPAGVDATAPRGGRA